MTFDEFTSKYFELDDDAAMRCIARESVTKKYSLTGSSEKLKAIVDTMDQEQEDRYFELLVSEPDKHPDMFESIAGGIVPLSILEMDMEEVESYDKNPFFMSVMQKSGYALLLVIITLGLNMILPLTSIGGITTRIIAVGLISYAVYALIFDIWKYIGFEKVKKGLMAAEEAGKAFEKMDDDACRQYAKQFIDFDEESLLDEEKLVRVGKNFITLLCVATGILAVVIAISFVSNEVKENLLFSMLYILLISAVFVLPGIAFKITKKTPGYTWERYKELKAKPATKDEEVAEEEETE